MRDPPRSESSCLVSTHRFSPATLPPSTYTHACARLKRVCVHAFSMFSVCVCVRARGRTRACLMARDCMRCRCVLGIREEGQQRGREKKSCGAVPKRSPLCALACGGTHGHGPGGSRVRLGGGGGGGGGERTPGE